MPSLDLTLKPAQLEFVAKPGASFTQAYQVTNNSSSPVVVSTSVEPWLPAGPDGSVTYQNVLSNPDFEFSLNNADLKLGQSFLLRAGESRQLVLKVKSSATTPQHDYYFTFFLTQDLTSSLDSDSNFTSAAGRLGSHLLISTSNTESPVSEAKITNFSASSHLVDTFFPHLQFTGQITNSSVYFFKPVGQLSLSKNGLLVQKMTIFPNNVLASSSRSFFCQSDNQPVVCTFSPPFWPGLYQATVTLDSPSASATTTFFVFPFSITFLSIVVLFSFLLLNHRRHP